MMTTKISPHLKDCIEYLWSLGYQTTDSGDGSNYAEGMEGSLPFDHIVIQYDDCRYILNKAHELFADFKRRNLYDIHFEVSYSPNDGLSFIFLSDINNTGQLRAFKK